ETETITNTYPPSRAISATESRPRGQRRTYNARSSARTRAHLPVDCIDELPYRAFMVMSAHVSSAPSRFRSKTFTALLAFLFGTLGAHRFYLYGWRDLFGWAHV